MAELFKYVYMVGGSTFLILDAHYADLTYAFYGSELVNIV